MGEAVGVAAALAVGANQPVAQIDTLSLRVALTEGGSIFPKKPGR
jgi:hypothetical protein